ncbi:MAG TPA: thermostable hemolysin, partial [Steroidobacteraceae bacterium]|nr:thermostable hemolysin [Steroidobacteraceae bacterium]
DHFGAKLKGFLPILVTLCDAQGGIQAAAGLRPADAGRLFIEQYTETSIERVLAAVTGQRTGRTRIVEVGNLATRLPGSARVLFRHLTSCLYEQGFDWVVFAGTADVRAIFRRMRIDLIPLCPADPARLGDARQDWGSYYDNQPVVMAGSIVEGCIALGLKRDPLALLARFGCSTPALPAACAG